LCGQFTLFQTLKIRPAMQFEEQSEVAELDVLIDETTENILAQEEEGEEQNEEEEEGEMEESEEEEVEEEEVEAENGETEEGEAEEEA
jgi:hypothetical protein